MQKKITKKMATFRSPSLFPFGPIARGLHIGQNSLRMFRGNLSIYPDILRQDDMFDESIQPAAAVVKVKNTAEAQEMARLLQQEPHRFRFGH